VLLKEIPVSIKNRGKCEKFILEFMSDIDTSGYNTNLYKTILKDMSDKQCDDYMKAIRDSKAYLVVFAPVFASNGITVENNLEIAKKYQLTFFEHLVITNDGSNPDYKTPIKYLVVDLPYRRQSQTLDKKISVPDDNKTIDELTYQPTGSSKGAKISYPELQVLIGMGLDNTVTELIKYRGGDRNGFNTYNAMFLRYGSANLKTLSGFSSGVESTKTLKSYLLGLHLKSTL
jgi:hypothetical protein